VDIRGVTIEFATANNAKFIKDNNIGVGAIIQLVRSGDVIPKIEAVIQPADEPMMPNVPWKWNETKVDAVLESMENNPMVLQKTIEFFFKKLDIKGVGPGNVKKMINAGFNTVPKILKATREELLTVDGFKDKTVEKIRTNIDNVIVNSSLVMIASATNIFGRGLGSSIIRNILHEYPNILESGESDETKINQIAQVENIGKKRAAKFIKNIPTFLSFLQEANLTQKLSEQLGQNVDPNHPLFEKRIVMTGFRDKPLKTALTELGAKIGSSVSQNTFVVLVNDEDEETSKTEEAKEKGIPIMLVDNFRKKYNL
jgi:NAD-dependent DNA ligase